MTPVDLTLIKDLWVPNVFIYNLKTFKVSVYKKKPVLDPVIIIIVSIACKVIDVLSRLAGLWVSPQKEIMYSQVKI